MLLSHLTDRHLCWTHSTFHLRALNEYPSSPLPRPAHLYLQCSLLFLPGLQSLPFVPPSWQLMPPHLTSHWWILSVKKTQITNPPTLKAFFHVCIFLAYQRVGAITLSFHGIVSKPVSMHYELFQKENERPLFWQLIPTLPLSPTAYNLDTSSPLHVMSPFKFSSTVPSPQPAPATAWQCSNSPEPSRFPSVKMPHCCPFAGFQKAGWPVIQDSHSSLSSTLLPCSFQRPGKVCWRQTEDLMLWGDLASHPSFNHSLLLSLTYLLSPQCLNCACI